jgi:hypothetical protein
MSVKFKVGFVMSAETLFGLIGKFLPVEDLAIEEIVFHEGFAPKPRAVAKLAKLPPSHSEGETPKPDRRGRNPTIKADQGMNAIILKLLGDGEPHRFREFSEALKAAGFSGNGVGGLLKRLVKYGLVANAGHGSYRAAKRG